MRAFGSLGSAGREWSSGRRASHSMRCEAQPPSVLDWSRSGSRTGGRRECLASRSGGNRSSSWRFPQPQQGLDVKCLREQIEQMHFRDFVAVARGGDLFWLPRRIGQDRHIAGEGGRIARKINNFPRVDLREVLGRLRANSGRSLVFFRNSSTCSLWQAIETPARSAFASRSRVAARFASTLTTFRNAFASGRVKNPTPAYKSSARSPRAFATTVSSKSSIKRRFTWKNDKWLTRYW